MPKFSVKVRDPQTGKRFEVAVESPGVSTQEQADEHVRKLPGARGGTHPGLEVNPAPEAIEEVKAELQPPLPVDPPKEPLADAKPEPIAPAVTEPVAPAAK